MNYFATGSITFTFASVSPALQKAKQGCCVWFVYRFFSKYSVVFVFALFSVGLGALKFLQDPLPFQTSHVGGSVNYNCTTDDPNALVSLLRSGDFGVSYNVIPVTPNKLAAVPNSKVNITKDASYVRATLKIANAQLADTGTYKCTVSVPPNKSDYKLTKITVKGMFVCLFVYILPASYDF